MLEIQPFQIRISNDTSNTRFQIRISNRVFDILVFDILVFEIVYFHKCHEQKVGNSGLDMRALEIANTKH